MTRPRQAARGRRSARRPRSPRPARRDEAHDRAPRPAANPPHPPPAPPTPGGQARSLARTLRMALLHAPVKRGDAAIAGRLVEYRIAFGGRRKRFRVAFLLYLESVKAGAQHEHELVAQHLAGGAQLTPVRIAF